MDFSNIRDSKKRLIYTTMWGHNSMITEEKIENTMYHGEKSLNSYSFKTDKKKCEGLESLFEIPQHRQNIFEEKYNQVCGGSGHEERRITTLHSSSLCALLFFYSVSESNPIYLKMDGVGEAKFTKSIFEYQNKVIESGGPSNVDVTLLGEYIENKDKKIILFLESKFAEYILDVSRSLEIKKKYLKTDMYSEAIYHDKFWSTNGISIEEDSSKEDFSLKSKKTMYLTGLKQMVSHYVGVRRFADGVNEKIVNSSNFYDTKLSSKQLIQKEVREFAMHGEVDLYLGAIAFDVFGGKDITLDEYRSIYNKLMYFMGSKLSNQFGKAYVKMIPQLLTYQDVFTDKRYRLDKKVIEFYFGNGK